MKHFENGKKAVDVKIAYIGGGSRGWARGLMSDLAKEEKMCGKVYLYDIDFEAAKDNEIIGNMMSNLPDCKSKWDYVAVNNEEEAYKDADFVVISILPGTFDEMESDVHAPEEYGIYQSVGDTVGPGGIVRAMRTIPMMKHIALCVKKYCPNAWVINYTNPMTVCTKTFFEVFPEIKAFGCCHEVYGSQELIGTIYNSTVENESDKIPSRECVETNVYGINHFTWIDRAQYQGKNLLESVMKRAIEQPDGLTEKSCHWMNKNFATNNTIAFALFRKYGVLAAAGDRHLVEFCPGKWFLESPEQVKANNFELTTVKWRKEDQQEKIRTTKDIIAGKKELVIEETGEEGVKQIVALLGLGSYVSNVNMPNMGQIPNLPLGAVVETNAYFSSDSVKPLLAGKIPDEINHLIIRHVLNQECIVKAVLNEDYETVFKAFTNDPNVYLPLDKARELFNKMLYNTKKYLPAYDKYMASQSK